MHALGRIAASAAVGCALLLGGTATASAHVTVHPDSTEPGEYAQLTFRVPTESAKASTTKVVITLPQDTPLTGVATKPVGGWSVRISEDTLPEPVSEEGGATLTKALHVVTWKATSDAVAIRPGQYQDFSVSAGPLPKRGTLSFPTIQYYSDGTVVKWNQHARGSAAPEHPAPTFAVHSAAMSAVARSEVPAASDTNSSDSTSRWLSGAALIAALVALGLAGVAARTRHRGGAPSAGSSADRGTA